MYVSSGWYLELQGKSILYDQASICSGGVFRELSKLQHMLPLLPQQKKRWIVAHRGVSDRCPESTRAAFDLAVAQQADAIECDVQLTADNQVVVCHDTTLERYGHPDVKIETSTLADLQQLDVGSWFHEDFAQQRLLSLEELLKEYGATVPLCIELKTEDVTVRQRDLLVRRLTAAVDVRHLQDQVAFLAFDAATLQCLRDVAPWARLVLNTHAPHLFDERAAEAQPWLNGVDGNINNLSNDVVQLVHQRQLTSLTFTCNSEEDVLKAWNLSVDVIITNDPARTRDILQQHRHDNHAA
jgi:glycerophosphoryl diester phosphodiesterase